MFWRNSLATKELRDKSLRRNSHPSARYETFRVNTMFLKIMNLRCSLPRIWKQFFPRKSSQLGYGKSCEACLMIFSLRRDPFCTRWIEKEICRPRSIASTDDLSRASYISPLSRRISTRFHAKLFDHRMQLLRAYFARWNVDENISRDDSSRRIFQRCAEC